MELGGTGEGGGGVGWGREGGSVGGGEGKRGQEGEENRRKESLQVVIDVFTFLV